MFTRDLNTGRDAVRRAAQLRGRAAWILGVARITFSATLLDAERPGRVLGLDAIPVFTADKAGKILIGDAITVVVHGGVLVADLLGRVTNDRVA